MEDNLYIKLKELNDIYKDLKYDNENVLRIAKDIIYQCISKGKSDIKISKTGDKEILIFRYIEEAYYNIIIDDDADVEFLYIPKDRENTKSEFFLCSTVNIENLTDKI